MYIGPAPRQYDGEALLNFTHPDQCLHKSVLQDSTMRFPEPLHGLRAYWFVHFKQLRVFVEAQSAPPPLILFPPKRDEHLSDSFGRIVLVTARQPDHLHDPSAIPCNSSRKSGAQRSIAPL